MSDDSATKPIVVCRGVRHEWSSRDPPTNPFHLPSATERAYCPHISARGGLRGDGEGRPPQW